MVVFVIHSHESAMGVHVWGRIRMGNTCTPMARRFFTTSAIWEALWLLRVGHKKPSYFLAPTSLPSFWGKPNASQCSHPPYGKVPAASNWGSLQAFLPIAECVSHLDAEPPAPVKPSDTAAPAATSGDTSGPKLLSHSQTTNHKNCERVNFTVLSPNFEVICYATTHN